ncbi:peroxisomal membrane protein 11-4 [Physcomitrium patens]|uniref:Peroxisomal biogenesis factor 11 n=1 Tax=Physcomitrium patens TaxID=3218 RepID=A0A2K1IGH7_PHYPA|nr:peroxisomal membrane protein 11-4-like [Physcomitrium patens]PNR28378.1 hypothetical protein PHYPA_028970 [Physcomitrium patens]|eukprot:XP_024364456.1 peroxisomal membrane protein 11-4-like [Physcomitrella patens]
MDRKKDTLDKLVIFLAKRDGIDKLVKTFQYVGKLGHYNLERRNPQLADRCKKLEVAAGLSRKAFRTGRFLTGFNALRTTTFPDHKLQVLSIFGYGGEMVYWFFDHFLWLSRVGVLDPELARRMSYISAFGEGFGYIFFIIADLIVIRRGLLAEARYKSQITELEELQVMGVDLKGDNSVATQVKRIRSKIAAVRLQRIMSVMSIIANVSDLIIALADVDPNPFVCHPVTLGISGLASACSGWYKNWPDS